ncbi:uncharacterized protein LOC111042390 [Myzus persicae]|uniref:uncharacterized protein LOC111042390 n=1 Tax=Myzus persicae TaxID=13164 RepID=UPI000B935E12|nr:uncharacterized protein LOC111042390 [Myzus persicae]
MKSERISSSIESSSFEVNASSDSPKSYNDSGSRKAVTRGVAGDSISAGTSKKVDRYAWQSVGARPNSQLSIDEGDGDGVKTDERTEMEDKMFLINRLLRCKHPKTKWYGDDDDHRPRSTDRPTVENDSGFDRYEAVDSRQSLCDDGESDTDGDDGSSTSSWLLGTDEVITKQRSRRSPEKLAPAATTAAKGRRQKKNPALGCNKTLTRRRRPPSAEKRHREERLLSSLLPQSPQPFEVIVDSGKYFANASAAPSRRQRERQIKDAYAASEQNTRTPAAARARRTTDRSHEASSCINRKMGNREITRTNKIIADKILNVRTTIPKAKK